ncbi:cation transporter [Acidianus sp. HS-5]|uniref:cation transporter n=1 Tax=Acidianus sp. HS-5 TaxID=2886040 RepID=UPI001F026BBC|nr:cation transporter [Acidianus sp. HS-5]BDC18323.1 cation transporter [Acidianus sp. HS-5]
MIPLEKLREVSRIFLFTGVLLLPVSILEIYFGETYRSAILIADSFHGFIDATSAILFSLLLNIIYRRSNKFPWGLYNLESISILFVTIFIVILSMYYINITIYDINYKVPTWLSLIIYSSSVLTLAVLIFERRYSWISLVRTDLTHSKLDLIMEIISGFAIIINEYYLTLAMVITIIGFILADAIRQFKEAIYSLIGVNYDAPFKERIKIILESLSINLKNVYVRKLGSFYMVYVVVSLPPDCKLSDVYRIRKTVKRVVNSFENVVMVEIKVVPEKIKKRSLISTNNATKVSRGNKVNETGRPKYSANFKDIKNGRELVKKAVTKD